MAQESPVIPENLRDIMRQNIDDCRSLYTKSSLPVLEERYAEHVEMLLNEVERLETGLDRLAEEYIREKWMLTDANRKMKELITKHAIIADIFGTEIGDIKEHIS